MKHPIFVLLLVLFSISAFAQKSNKSSENRIIETDFTDCQAIITIIKNFYIGDHTGSIKHKKLSMHENGAYRYVNKEGKYKESEFRLDSDNADPNYKEELLSIEIYDKISFARLRLDQFHTKIPEYKLMILHKVDNQWKITSIYWGYGIKQ
ncbi:hypothetical protein [Cellulophaga baltica]|uniref:hypothetical protein n=1 Tax=Cellulophaga baltica TaxID=76594 RepID=UPI000472A45D|nr:hypothetical protein [Cellulophaga baltica]AIY12598.1 hypothetical protein M667_04930 [Cellulophaga baltica NN016038]